MRRHYDLRLSAESRRSLEVRLPLAIALAVWEFCEGPLRIEPRRLGRPLQRELAGYYSARRGGYRVIYRVDEKNRVVHVVRIEHRSDVYRPR